MEDLLFSKYKEYEKEHFKNRISQSYSNLSSFEKKDITSAGAVVDDQSNNCTINEHQRTDSDLENEGSGKKLSNKGSKLRRTEYSAAYLKE